MKVSKKGTRRRGVAVLSAVAALAIYMVVVAMPASAAETCVVSGASPTQTMTVNMDADGDAVTLLVDGAGNIDFNGGDCTPVATTAGVSEILVNAVTPAEVEDQTVTIDGSGGSFTASISIDTGAGNDVVVVNATVAADAVTANLGDGNDGFNSTTALGPVTVNGVGGNDTILAGEANDELNAGDGNNGVIAGAGNDMVTSGNGADGIIGEGGGDTVFAGGGGDNIFGNAGRDTLWGEGGSDAIDAGDGSDTVAPGGGDDGTSATPIQGGPGRNTISFADLNAAVDVDLGAGSALTGNEEDVFVDFVNVTGSPRNDKIRATLDNNDIASGNGNDSVRAAGGADDVRGGGGKDRLRGGDGDDDLFGQGGKDRLFGGPGVDFCNGGPGKDKLKGCE